MAGFADFVSITDFGAVSGSDCTAAFQAAVGAGQPIYIPAGQAWILGEGEIDLAASPGSSIVIAGAGSLATVLQVRGAARSVFRFAPDEIPSRHPTSFEFRGFSINGMEGRVHAGITIIGPDVGSGTLSTVFIDRMFFGNLATALMLKRVANLCGSNIQTQSCTCGIDLFKCPDTDLVNIRVHNGDGAGFWFSGELEDHRSEGIRLCNCSTNGQHIGFIVDNCAFVNLNNCDTSDAPGGGVVLRSSKCVHVTGGEFSTCPDSPEPAIAVDAASSLCQFTGLLFYCAGTGISLLGEAHSVVGCQGIGNSRVDIVLGARSSVVSGNKLSSTASPQSVLELPGADYNSVSGNISAGAIELCGGSSEKSSNMHG